VHQNNYNKFRSLRPNRNSNDDRPKRGLTVEVRNNDVNKAIRRLKKLMNNEGIIKEVRDRQYYQKPSDKKRFEKNQATRRWQKKQQKLRDQGLID
jgi:small subunit ribosomal protein S21